MQVERFVHKISPLPVNGIMPLFNTVIVKHISAGSSLLQCQLPDHVITMSAG